MSDPVRDRLRELEADVQHLTVLPAAAVRARGRRRGRRQFAVLATAGAVVAVTVGAAVAWPQQHTAKPTVTVPVADRPAISCVLALPDDPAEVQVRVLGGGAPAGKVDETISGLRARRFTLVNGTNSGDTADVATLRYGPAAIGAATVLRAVVHGGATMRFDPGRSGKTIDLILGPAFTRLGTATEINQNLVTAGPPTAPPECPAGR